MDNKCTEEAEEANTSTLATKDSQREESRNMESDRPFDLSDSRLDSVDSQRVEAAGECSTTARTDIELEALLTAESGCVTELNQPRIGRDGGNSQHEGTNVQVQPPESLLGVGERGDEVSFGGERDDASESDQLRIGDGNEVTEVPESQEVAGARNSSGGEAQEVINGDESPREPVSNEDGAEGAMDDSKREERGAKDDVTDREGIQDVGSDKGARAEIMNEAEVAVVEEETKLEDSVMPDMAKEREVPLVDVSASVTDSVAIPYEVKDVVDAVEESSTLRKEKDCVGLADTVEEKKIKTDGEDVKILVDSTERNTLSEKKEIADTLGEKDCVGLADKERKMEIETEGKEVKNVADLVEDRAILSKKKEIAGTPEGKDLVGLADKEGEREIETEGKEVKDMADSAEETKILSEKKENADISVAEAQNLLEEKDTVTADTVEEKGQVAHMTGEVEIQQMEMADVEKEVDEIWKGKECQNAEKVEMDTEDNEANKSNEKEVIGELDGRGTLESSSVEDRTEAQEDMMLLDDMTNEGVEKQEPSLSDVAEVTQTVIEETGVEERSETQEENAMADTGAGMEMAQETEEPDETEEAEEADKSVGGKRKRGKNSKPVGKGAGRKKVEEDVCFICFDGGDLVLCDRRGCPKAYHPSCVGHDEAFFQTKGKWNCGWHLCSNCRKNAQYMCLTCTFSLCKGCIKDVVIYGIRGNKGLCETCMETVKSIERKELEKREVNQVDSADTSSWEYLFKDYWNDLKIQLSITIEDLDQARSLWKGHDQHSNKQESSYKLNDDEGSGSESSPNAEQTISKRRKTRRQSKSNSKRGETLSRMVSAKSASTVENAEWASKELMEIVMHMRSGDKSFLPRSEVHSLLLDYIKRYNLRDPRRKSQVVCDPRLQNLFRKPHVGHFEMLNLLDSHFLIKEDSQADGIQGSVVDVDASNLDLDENCDAKTGKDKKRKTRRKGDSRGRQSNLDDYAAIDMHNINLIYLRRNLVEDLLDDPEAFHEKVVGSFLRLKIPGNQKQDLYRLVQVVGTSKVAEPYKVGKKTTDLLLEIQNLNKTEVISIDTISNQDFTEDECKRLRQSIKCGLINRLSVGDIQEKAMRLQEVRVKNWLEAEIQRLSHLRDRASDMGRRKELRECVEKLQVLKSPEERQRRIEEIPEIHADPNMDPNYESEEENEPEDKEQDYYPRSRGSGFSRRGREPVSPRRVSYGSSDSWCGTRNTAGKGLFNKGETAAGGAGEMMNDNSWSMARDREHQQLINKERPRTVSFSDTVARAAHSVLSPDLSSRVVSEIPPASPFTGATQPSPLTNESEKMWHYKDPSGKVQGPFSMVQLRKWNNTGYFPADLRIWKTNEKPEESILLTNALAGKFQKDPPPIDSFAKAQMVSGNPHLGSSESPLETSSSKARVAPSSLGIPRYSQDVMSSSTNLPSPTPNRTPTSARRRSFESRWSPTPPQQSASFSVTNQPMANSSPSPSSLIIAGGMETSTFSQGPRLASRPEISMLSPSENVPPMQSPSMVSADRQELRINSSPILTQRPEMILTSPTSGSGTQNWGSAQSQKLAPGSSNSLPTQISIYGHNPSFQNSYQSLNGGNPIGVFPSQNQPAFPPSETWRSLAPSQSNVQAAAAANAPWGMNMLNTPSTTPRLVPQNHNSSWGPMPENPNMGWGGPGPAGTSMNWAASAPVSAQVNSNPGWFGPNQAQGHGNSSTGWGMNGQAPTPGNPLPSWGPPGQILPPANGNSGWAASSQGPNLGNPNPSWAAPSANQGSWPNQQNHNADRFPGRSHGGSSGYGGGNPWNGQSQFGGGGGDGNSLRRPFKSQRVCKFYRETGHCKKGASCDYLHN